MDIEQLSSLGWREGLIAIIALLLLYIIVLFVRMRRLQRDLQATMLLGKDKVAEAADAAAGQPAPTAGPAVAPAPAPAPATAAAAAATATVAPSGELQVAVADAALLAAPVDGLPAASAVALPDEPDFAWNEPPPEIPGQALIDALQRDVYQLRDELDELRSDLLAAREDIRRILAQAAEPVAATAPLYKDAMQLATQGHDAATIARHCAIARAEADLIVALARNRQDGIQ